MPAPRTYGFTGVSFSMSSPLAGDFVSAGQVGLSELHVMMTLERSIVDMASDGTPMPSYISGSNGTVQIIVQQTSIIHSFLLQWFNLHEGVADNGDPSLWAASSFTIQSLTDGSYHVATGVMPSKIPDKPYQERGQKVTWTLMCCDVKSVSYLVQ